MTDETRDHGALSAANVPIISVKLIPTTQCKAKTNEKPIKIFNKEWPLEIFANNRILKLKILETYEINSTGTNSGEITNGIATLKN